MNHSSSNPSRRTALKTGIASVGAAGALTAVDAQAYAKKPGETKVVAVMGDYWHHPFAQEIHVRGIFSSLPDWRIMFVRASRFLTPELISDADLLIAARYGGRDAIGWSTEGIVDKTIQGDNVWNDEIVAALVDNVKNRGMGFMSIHCTLFSGNRTIEDLIGVEPLLHQEVQPVIVKGINQDHPITRGIESYFVNLDEQFDCQIKNPATTTLLFRTLAVHDKRDAVGGWCLEQGNGRVVGLLPGHTQWAYRIPNYQEIFWRAAHWALKRDIPTFTTGRNY